MSTRTIRGAGAAVLTLGLITSGLTSAQAAIPSAPTPTPGAFTRAPISGLAGHRSELPTLKNLSSAARSNALSAPGQSPGTSSLAAAASGIVEMSSFCPSGQTPTGLSYESFEGDLPYPSNSSGFTVQAGPGAPDGASWAQSAHQSTDPAIANWVESNYAAVPQTGKVYLTFTYRGQFAAQATSVSINDDGGNLIANPGWATVALDITSQATTNGGMVDIFFDHSAGASTSEEFAVDDVSVYRCKAIPSPAPAPNSGVRGDWTGQGTVDLMGTGTNGNLYVYEGTGTGTVRSGVQVGSGWSGFTWQGSPGDINGDRRTDLLARRSDGTLWFYPGKGAGFLGSGKQVGGGWNGMTAIATPGDINLDGRPDLIARRADGTLHDYRILATGGLQYVRQIGNGWNTMTAIIGMGDLNGDKRGDLIARRSDGVLFSFLSTGTGLTSAKKIGTGWNGMNILTSPGDMNRDGRSDLVGRNANGTLWSYLGGAAGTILSGKQIGTSWNGMLRIL